MTASILSGKPQNRGAAASRRPGGGKAMTTSESPVGGGR